MSTITETQPVGLAQLRQIDPFAAISFVSGIVGLAIVAVPAIAISAGINYAQEAQ